MFGLLPLIVLGLIVWAVVAAVRGRRATDLDDLGGGVGSARRFFQYAIAYAALLISCSGLSSLFDLIVRDTAARDSTDFAGPLAMTIVGVPVFIAVARWIWAGHGRDPLERRTVAWGTYLTAALVSTLSVAVGLGFAAARDLVDGVWRSGSLVSLVVWMAAWAAHWWAWRRARPAVLPRAHVWVGSVIGLVVFAVSAGFIISALGERLLGVLASGVVATVGTDELVIAAFGAFIGSAVWSWHWIGHGLGSERTEGWFATVLLAGVLGGLLAAVTGAGHGLYLVLEWLFGESTSSSAVGHFQDSATALATMAVGSGVWLYHRAVVGPSADRERTDVDRAYDYLVAGVGLGTVAVATVVLVMAVFAALGEDVAATDGGSNTLLLAVTLLVVGLPVWAIAWFRVQRIAARDADLEVGSAGRRTYLFAVFGVGGVVAFGALIALLVAVFEAMLEDTSGPALADRIDMPTSLLVATGIGAVYHWIVYRAERGVAATGRRRHVLLVRSDPALDDVVASLAGVRVRGVRRTDLETRVAASVIADAIEHTPGDRLLVLAGADGVEVVSIE